MRSLAWVYCAAILGGTFGSLTTAAGQDNWRFPPRSREIGEVSLVAHVQTAPPLPAALPPTPDEEIPAPQPPGPKAPWLVDDPSVGPSVSATKDEALQSPNCGCEDIQYVCCPPSWTVRAEALFWDRTSNRTRILATTDAGVALAADDLNFDYSAGPRLTLQRQNLIGAWGVELAYFGIDGFSATAALPNTTALPTIPPVNIIVPQPVAFDYSSRIYSSEVNLRRPLTERLTFVNGFRWVEFTENLNTNIGGGLATHNVNTNNHLYGYQLGGDYRFWGASSRWFADGVVKAGIYRNSSDQVTNAVGIGGAVPAAFATDTNVAFLGEAGVYGGYRLTDAWRVIGGYSVLYMTGIADAPGQLGTTNIATGVATVNNGGSPFFHGATMGLEWVR